MDRQSISIHHDSRSGTRIYCGYSFYVGAPLLVFPDLEEALFAGAVLSTESLGPVYLVHTVPDPCTLHARTVPRYLRAGVRMYSRTSISATARPQVPTMYPGRRPCTVVRTTPLLLPSLLESPSFPPVPPAGLPFLLCNHPTPPGFHISTPVSLPLPPSRASGSQSIWACWARSDRVSPERPATTVPADCLCCDGRRRRVSSVLVASSEGSR